MPGRPPNSTLLLAPFQVSAFQLCPCPAFPLLNFQPSTFNLQLAGHPPSLPIPKGLPPSAQGCDAPPFCVATLGNASVNSANPESGCIIRSIKEFSCLAGADRIGCPRYATAKQQAKE